MCNGAPPSAPPPIGHAGDDVNCGLFGGGCASVDSSGISHKVCLYILTKPPVRRDKSTSSRASNLIMLRKFGLTLGFVGALLFVLVERVIYLHRRNWLFLCKRGQRTLAADPAGSGIWLKVERPRNASGQLDRAEQWGRRGGTLIGLSAVSTVTDCPACGMASAPMMGPP